VDGATAPGVIQREITDRCSAHNQLPSAQSD